MKEKVIVIGGRRIYIPARVEAEHTLASNTKAKEVLGWSPAISIEEGIKELRSEAGLI